MRVKAKIAPLSCPDKRWMKTTDVYMPKDIDADLIIEAKKMWKHIKKQKIDNHEQKIKVIELYNTIHGTNFSNGTNCSSCLLSIWRGYEAIIKKYGED